MRKVQKRYYHFMAVLLSSILGLFACDLSKKVLDDDKNDSGHKGDDDEQIGDMIAEYGVAAVKFVINVDGMTVSVDAENPIPDIRVQMGNVSSDELTDTISDENGSFELKGKQGTYSSLGQKDQAEIFALDLDCEKNGGTFKPASVKVAVKESDNGEKTIEASDLKIAMSKAEAGDTLKVWYDIGGSVVDEESASPIKGVRIQIGDEYAVSNSQGKWQFSDYANVKCIAIPMQLVIKPISGYDGTTVQEDAKIKVVNGGQLQVNRSGIMIKLKRRKIDNHQAMYAPQYIELD